MAKITREEARLIAQELMALIRPDIKKVVKEITERDQEEFLTLSQAAQMLGISPGTLYRTKYRIGYTKVGNQLRFPKSSLIRAVYNGKMRAENAP